MAGDGPGKTLETGGCTKEGGDEAEPYASRARAGQSRKYCSTGVTGEVKQRRERKKNTCKVVGGDGLQYLTA
jgi:hypothetical protein